MPGVLFNPIMILILSMTVPLYGQIPDLIHVSPKLSTNAVNYNADDPAIWIHPTDPTKSLLLGTDIGTYPNGGIFVWNMDGSLRQRIIVSHPKHIDVRYGMQLSTGVVDVAVVTLRDHWQIRVFKIDPESQILLDITTPDGINIFKQPFGLGLFKRPSDGAIFAFVSSRHPESKTGILQLRLEDDGNGFVKGTLQRVFGENQSFVEGIVVDDELGYLYLAEEDFGIHKYYADAANGDERLAFFARDDGIVGNRSGLAIYKCSDKTGFLLVANPGTQSIKVYRREGDERNPHSHNLLTTIKSVGGEFGAGIDITNLATTDILNKGFLIWQNKTSNKFGLYAWPDIAGNFLPICSEDEMTTSVDLGYFTATQNGNQIDLKWQMNPFLKVADLELQRRSSGSSYRKIAGLKDLQESDKNTYLYSDKPNAIGRFFYRLKLILNSGEIDFSNEIIVKIESPTHFELKQNYPNPFNPETKIAFAIPTSSRVKLLIYNLMGKEIKVVLDAYLPSGFHDVDWDGLETPGRPATSGIYFYKLQANEFSSTKRMMLLR
ncbi:MAG: phytase [bacterium]